MAAALRSAAAPTFGLLLLVLLSCPWALAADGPAATPSSTCPPRRPSNSTLSAVCALEIIGKGRDVVGLDRLRLSCNSTNTVEGLQDPDAAPNSLIPVGIASAAPNTPLAAISASVRQQLEQYGSGITVIPQQQLECQRETEAPGAAADLVPLFGLLYFCEGSITLVNPVIRDLLLPYALRSRAQEDTAPVVFGGTARVSVEGARVERVDASTALAVLQDAQLSVVGSVFDANSGNPGSGVFARDRSMLSIASSNFTNSNSSDHGGALAVMGCCNATVADSVFANCSAAFSGGALYVNEAASLVVSNSLISGNTAGTGRAAQSQGGGIFCQGQYLGLVNGTQVLYNTAHGSGGGLYTSISQSALAALQGGGPDGASSSGMELHVSPDTVLSWNQAVGSDASGPSAGGGAFLGFMTTFEPSVMRAVARSNSAVRDADVGTEPDKLTVAPSTVLGYVARPEDLDGGLRVEVSLVGEGGFPCGGRIIRAYWDSNSAAGVGAGVAVGEPVPPSLTSPPKHTAATDASGVAVMFLRFAEPPGRHLVKFTVENMPYDVSTELTAEVRQCWKGEQEQRPGVCKVCPRGTYSFDPVTAGICRALIFILPACRLVCLPVPAHCLPRCPNPRACTPEQRPDGRGPKLLECSDAWSSSRATATRGAALGNSSDSSDPCYMTSGFVVQYNSSFADDQCAEGYLGRNLCGRCAEGWGPARPFRCRKCYSKGLLVFMYVVACLLLLGFMKLVCWLTLRPPAPTLAAHSTTASCRASAAAAPVNAAHLVRQLVLFCQYLLIIATVQAAESWPASIAKPLDALAWLWAPASPQTLARACLAGSGATGSGAATVVFFVVLPLVLLALLLLLEVLLRVVRERKQGRGCGWDRLQLGQSQQGSSSSSSGSFRDQLITSSMVVVEFFLPAIVRSAFGLFACVSINRPARSPNTPMAVGSFWIHDPAQQCFVGWHLRLAVGLGIPLLLFVLFVPGFILFKTTGRGSRERLGDPLWLRHYGFLVDEYRPRFRFWEAIVATQTILLVAISVFSYSSPYYQAVLMNVAVALIWLLLAVAKPHAHAETQRVSLVGMGCLFLTSYSALAFVQIAGQASSAAGPSDNSPEAGAIPTFMGVVVIVTNAAFVAWVLWKLGRSIEWQKQWQRVSSAKSSVLALVSSASRDLPAVRAGGARVGSPQSAAGARCSPAGRGAGLCDDVEVELSGVGGGDVKPVGDVQRQQPGASAGGK